MHSISWRGGSWGDRGDGGRRQRTAALEGFDDRVGDALIRRFGGVAVIDKDQILRVFEQAAQVVERRLVPQVGGMTESLMDLAEERTRPSELIGLFLLERHQRLLLEDDRLPEEHRLEPELSGQPGDD